MAIWGIRLRVRCAKAIGTSDASFDFDFEGRQCRLSGSPRDAPLNSSKWWIISATNFASESDAQAFGIKLGRALRLAGISRENGLDFGKDRASVSFGKAVHDAVTEAGSRIMPNVHGLLVYEDRGNEVFFNIEANATITEDPNIFSSSLKAEALKNLDWDTRLTAAVDLISRSKIATEPLTQAALSISALEHLANEKPWTEGQLELFALLQDVARDDTSLAAGELDEVVKALGQNFKSIRQSVRAKLKELAFGNDDLKDFDRIYGLRSGIFHGSQLDPDNYQILANDARNFSTKVIMAAVNASSPKHYV